jgi:hypothetical protein
MKIYCGTPEACSGCDDANILSAMPLDTSAIITDVMTGRPDLQRVSFLQLRGLVDDAYETRTEELPALDISTALVKAVRRISSGNCEVVIS